MKEKKRIPSLLRASAMELSEVVKYRELLNNLVMRDLKVRYGRSVLGFVWMMLNPLLMMVVLSLVFSGLFRVSTGNYTVSLLSGIIMWNLFSQSTSITVRSFLDHSYLIRNTISLRPYFRFLHCCLPSSISFFRSCLLCL